MDPISTLASYAAVGALAASAVVLLTGKEEDDAPRWILRGTVVGGIVGVGVLIARGLS